MLQIDLNTLFNEHKANETSYKRKLKAYWETYIEFRYDSPSTTPEHNFNISNFNQYEVGPRGEVQDIYLDAPMKLKGGDTTEEAVDEQIMAQSEE